MGFVLGNWAVQYSSQGLFTVTGFVVVHWIVITSLFVQEGICILGINLRGKVHHLPN